MWHRCVVLGAMALRVPCLVHYRLRNTLQVFTAFVGAQRAIELRFVVIVSALFRLVR